MAARGERSTKKKGRASRTPRLDDLSFTVQSDESRSAGLILARARESAQALLKAIQRARDERGNPRGMTTDEEQNLLRAMLVMATAGLDAMFRQLIRDVLPSLIDHDQKVRSELEKFISRRVRGAGTVLDSPAAEKFLARVLSHSSPQKQVIEEYIAYLTGASLQSTDKLFETAGALGAPPEEVGIEKSKRRPICDVRDKINHELDINLCADRRNRNVRSKSAMIRGTNAVLKLAKDILVHVEPRIARAS